MADDPQDPQDPKPDTKEELGDAGKKALEAERKARREAEKAKADLEARLKALEDKDKSELEKATGRVAELEQRAAKAEGELLRLSIGTAKGLTPVQARRLVGTTAEELEADADELLSTFGAPPGDAPPSKPKEDLKGGADPTVEPAPDMREVVSKVPRGF